MDRVNVIKELSIKYNLTEKEITEIVHSPFAFIVGTISEMEFRGDETEEEFNEIAKNFNLPCIGKVHSSYNKFKSINSRNNEKRRSVK